MTSLVSAGGTHLIARITSAVGSIRVVPAATLIDALVVFQQEGALAALQTAIGRLVRAAQTVLQTRGTLAGLGVGIVTLWTACYTLTDARA